MIPGTSDYETGKKTCGKLNSHLLDFTNENYQEKLFDVITVLDLESISGVVDFFIGLTDVQTENRWIWERSGVELSSDLNNRY